VAAIQQAMKRRATSHDQLPIFSANDVADAVRMIAADPTAKFIAGGTNLVDLMKDDVERPSRLIDISRLPLKTVDETPEGGLRIARSCQIPISPITHWWSVAIHCWRAQSWRAPRNNCATWPRPPAICCSGRVAPISTTRQRPATNARPAAAAQPSTVKIAYTRSSVRAKPASRYIRPTCA
jgi:hypothetical protein